MFTKQTHQVQFKIIALPTREVAVLLLRPEAEKDIEQKDRLETLFKAWLNRLSDKIAINPTFLFKLNPADSTKFDAIVCSGSFWKIPTSEPDKAYIAQFTELLNEPLSKPTLLICFSHQYYHSLQGREIVPTSYRMGFYKMDVDGKDKSYWLFVSHDGYVGPDKHEKEFMHGALRNDEIMDTNYISVQHHPEVTTLGEAVRRICNAYTIRETINEAAYREAIKSCENVYPENWEPIKERCIAFIKATKEIDDISNPAERKVQYKKYRFLIDSEISDMCDRGKTNELDLVPLEDNISFGKEVIAPFLFPNDA